MNYCFAYYIIHLYDNKSSLWLQKNLGLGYGAEEGEEKNLEGCEA